MKQIEITWNDIKKLLLSIDNSENVVYGVPKNGMILTAFLNVARATHNPVEANIILDDIIDTGRTKQVYERSYPEADFIALFDKNEGTDKWLVMPWENDHPGGKSIHDNIIRQLQFIGEDPEREGLKDTPNRIVRSWNEIYSGYEKDPSKLFTTFEAGTYDQIILLKDIELFSICEHHMLPFHGKAHVAYIPNDEVIGISKLARLVDIYARRLQIQERIGEQVTNDLMTYLNPKGAACVIEATHLCMRMRGVNKQESTMMTSSLKGCFYEEQSARQELMNLLK